MACEIEMPQWSEGDWSRFQGMLAAAIKPVTERMDRLDEHLRATDTNVKAHELQINGDPNSRKEHPGMAPQLEDLVSERATALKVIGVAVCTVVAGLCTTAYVWISKIFAAGAAASAAAQAAKVKP